jgi:hypothetical protein
MAGQTFDYTEYRLVFDATAVGNSTAEAIMAPDWVINPPYLNTGRALNLKIWGKVSSIVTTPGTLTFQIRYGGVTGTSLCASAAIALNAVAQTTDTFMIDADIIVRSEGTSGTAIAQASVLLGPDASTNVVNFMPATGAAVTTIDTTSSKALSVTAQFSVANAGNTLTVQQYYITSRS